ncbi:MAG: Rieske 2Fe-2S domain-containing protein [Planctomycetia bacterium]|nr:Rieske 2Fe-2S domain-containing protein [Planctomycetia bacterium]
MSTAGEPPRRSFLMEFFAAAIGGVVGLVPLAAGALVYFDPLRRKKPAASAVPITSLDAIPDATNGDALIGIYKISANRQDAWNLYPNEPIGSVYLVVPKGTKEVKALNATCPHLGCFVDVNQSEGGYSFLCPCHTSAFHGDGSRIMPCVSPRDMDELVCKTEPNSDKSGYDVSVVFQNFQPGLAKKTPKT